MTEHKTLTPEMLHKLLVCDAVAGTLFWRARTADMFSDDGYGGAKGEVARWNAKYARKPALANTGDNNDR